ncbi:MAG TPA: hypothetical protein DCW83_06555 [Saprospirales bacterium]|nr:hypothetical protein [Saprospirales bacterium]
MERFGSFIKDEGFYMSNGVVTLSKAIGDKTPRTKRIKGGIFEGFDTTGFKQAKTEKRVDHQHHEPRNDLHDNKKRTHIDDAQKNKNVFGETGTQLRAWHRDKSDIEEVGSLSSKLEQKMTPAQHKAFRHFTAGKSDTVGDGKKWASSQIAQHFITKHKLKTENKKLGEYHPHALVGQDKDAADHLKTAAKPLGHRVHLYSGVHPSFVKAIKHAEKHTDGVVHSPAHISTTHDVHTAAGFAVHSGHDSTQFFPLNKNTNNENVGKTTKHMIHVHAEASNKGIHMSGVEGNKHAAEAETVLPPGTHLKYSHTTHHYHTVIDSNGDHDHHRIDVHHCTIHKQD